MAGNNGSEFGCFDNNKQNDIYIKRPITKRNRK